MIYRVYSESNLVSLHCPINFECSIKGIGVRITGTNGATAAQLADVGRITYKKNGKTLVSMGYDFIQALNHILGGNPKDNTTASGALDFYSYIPRRFFDRNVDYITKKDNAVIEASFNSNLDTRVSSGGLVEVYLDIEEGVQAYDLCLNQYTDSASGSGVWPISIKANPNLLMVAVSDVVSNVLTLSSSNYSQVVTRVGDRVSSASIGALLDHTNFMMNLETDFSLCAVPFVASGDITSKLDDSVSLEITTGGTAQMEIGIMSANFNDEKNLETIKKQRARFNDKTRQASEQGRASDVTVVKRLAGYKTAGA